MAAGRTITVQDAIEHARTKGFSTASGATGAEVEWLVVDRSDRLRRPSIEEITAALPPLGRSRLTFEPGGQLELSSPAGSLREIIRTLGEDEALVRSGLRSAGLELLGAGLDPVRADRRLVFAPRYDAMERFFDRDGADGRRMMCGTASIQVNVDAGGVGSVDDRWRLAHEIGPVLVAAFANSSQALGRPTGWRSGRLANWWRMDPSRTRPAFHTGDARADWARYALGASVMMIRNGGGWIAPEDRLPFRAWIERGYAGIFPTLDDLDYHMTTLFPPVRARGWLELRFLDAQPGPWWRAAVAATVALMNDPVAADKARAACAPLAGRWTDAARSGVRASDFRAAARACLSAAVDALPRLGAGDETCEIVAAFRSTFTDRGRCPADGGLVDVREASAVVG